MDEAEKWLPRLLQSWASGTLAQNDQNRRRDFDHNLATTNC